MLTRRHIRVKVLQSLYSFHQSEQPDLEKQEKFMWYSLDQMQDLFALMLRLPVAIRNQAESYLTKLQNKHLATQADRNPSRNFINNEAIALIADNPELNAFLKNKKLRNWEQDDEYVNILFKSLREQDWYEEYLAQSATSFDDDLQFLIRLYKEVIAPNDKLYEYLEDQRLTWMDDFPIVNTTLVKLFGKLKPSSASAVLMPNLYKNEDDKDFALQLLRKTVLHDDALTQTIDGKTPNWDKERIAEMDMIILKMGIAEFLYFPSIPVRASINEYLEIAKEYSTPKSSLFINGILDKLVKEFTDEGKLNKIGRGLR